MKKSILKVAISAVLLIIATVIKSPELKIVFYGLSYMFIGLEVLIGAIKDLFNKEILDEEFLMSVASIGAFEIGEYPEAIAIMLFYEIGEIFENYAEERSRKSIKNLMKIKPDYANVKQNDDIIKKSPEEVKIGDIIIVKSGEKVPLDGIVINGEALIDTSAITGESVPRTVKENEEIYSGSINTNSILEIKVTKEFKESTVNKILELVENATEKKAHTEKFITKFAKIYTPIVVLLAILLCIIPTFILKQDSNIWIYKALTFLVVSCPCALVISVPLSFFGGIGGASKRGILIKGSNYLEILSKLDTVVFDKTGTLTKGNFKVSKIEPEENKEEILKIAAYCENYSNHPIANSIKEAYGKKIEENKISNFEEIAGKGIKVLYENKQVYIGNSKLMQSIGIKIEKEETYETIVYISIDGKLKGKISIADEIKPDSKQAIADLKKQGIIQTIMLTGDRKEVGQNVGKELNIDQIHTELLPTDKVKILEEILKNKKGTVAFIGDGLNDAPAIAMADVGIAMGGYGTDAAIEVADVAIMTDEPSKICKAIQIAKNTMKIAKENIWLSIGIKIIVLLLSLLGKATMWEAVFADVGVTIIATLNSLRTLR